MGLYCTASFQQWAAASARYVIVGSWLVIQPDRSDVTHSDASDDQQVVYISSRTRRRPRCSSVSGWSPESHVSLKTRFFSNREFFVSWLLIACRINWRRRWSRRAKFRHVTRNKARFAVNSICSTPSARRTSLNIAHCAAVAVNQRSAPPIISSPPASAAARDAGFVIVVVVHPPSAVMSFASRCNAQHFVVSDIIASWNHAYATFSWCSCIYCLYCCYSWSHVGTANGRCTVLLRFNPKPIYCLFMCDIWR